MHKKRKGRGFLGFGHWIAIGWTTNGWMVIG